MASASRVIASKGPAPLRTWCRTRRRVTAVLQLLQPRDDHQVEARLLRVGLAELLAEHPAQEPLVPRDRAAEAPRRADERRIGLDDRPLHELLDRQLVGGLDAETTEILPERRAVRALDGLFRFHRFP